ncbi:MAG: low molecular weight protein-tyrosine-phosphatase [Bacteroidales bacterium]|nr:low molecular weight protein-tyrosine-phosphatase [Bacteroidales bacterium]
MKRILFVCHGNICRSPMAEFVFRKMVKDCGREDDFYIESAAVSDEEYGNPIYPPARRCMSQHGIPFDSSKTARTMTRRDYEAFDLIIIMDGSNRRWLRYIIGEDTQDKVRMMMSFVGENRDVADPWYTGDFERTYQDVSRACKSLLSQF